MALVRKPLFASLNVPSIPNEVQNGNLDTWDEFWARDSFRKNRSLSSMYETHPNVIKLASKLLLPFAFIYLCDSGFSILSY